MATAAVGIVTIGQSPRTDVVPDMATLLPAGTPVTPGVIGLAAACGYDTIGVRAAPAAAVLVFGDELLTAGLPGNGRVRDSLGPSVPAWLRRLGTSIPSVARYRCQRRNRTT